MYIFNEKEKPSKIILIDKKGGIFFMSKTKRFFAVLFTLMAVMLMSTVVFAEGSGTKDDPYIAKNGPYFVYYCQQGGYIKVEAEEMDIYNTPIQIDKDLNIDMGKCVCTIKSMPSNWRILINHVNVTISAEEYGGIRLEDTNSSLFYVNDGSLTLNGGIYTNNIGRTIIGADSTITLNGIGETVEDSIALGVADVKVSGGKLIVNNAAINPIINGITGKKSYNSYPTIIENAGFECNRGYLADVRITKDTSAENINLRYTSFEHILVESSDYNISDLIGEDSYIVKYYSHNDSFEKVNADVKELTSDYEYYYIIISPIEVSAVDVNITAPKAGKTPDVSAEINTDGVTLYKTDPITWYKDGKSMENTDVFEVGHKYTLSVWLQAKDGYYFATDKSLSPSVTGSLNGTSATIGTAYEQAADEVINLSYDFGTLQKTTISAIEITVGIPQAGKTPDFAPTANAGCVLYADKSEKGYGIDWYDSDESIYLDKNDVFKEGHSYIMEVFYKPDENYLFVNKMTASVNGVELKGYISPENSAKYKLIQVFYDIPVKGDVDGNDIVEDADAVLLMKYITGVEPALSELQLEAAKVTDSTKAEPDMLDVIWILNNKTAA